MAGDGDGGDGGDGGGDELASVDHGPLNEGPWEKEQALKCCITRS